MFGLEMKIKENENRIRRTSGVYDKEIRLYNTN